MITLFWDKNTGKAMPRALRMLRPPGVTVAYYLELYPDLGNVPEGGDDFWLRDIGENGWFVISQDYNLYVRQNELFAIKQYNLGCFYLWGASNSRWETFRCFVRGYDRIIESAATTPRPFLYAIRKTGRLDFIPLPP